MLVFEKEKLVLLAMTKTASTSLDAALAGRAALILRNPPILKHTPVSRFHRFLEPYFTSGGFTGLETVAVVRHPVSWLGSWYRYRSRDDLRGNPNSTEHVTFDDFVDEYAKDEPAPFARVGNPAHFLRMGDGTFNVDHLFQYEQLGKVVSFFEGRLKMAVTLPQRNISPEMDLTLSPQIEAKLERKWPDMFEDWERARR